MTKPRAENDLKAVNIGVKRLVSTGFAFLAALAFLRLTVPANHTEAEDAYFYARMAESGQGAELFHRHHLLYLPLARGLYRIAQAFGYHGRAFPILVGLSAVAGATVIAILFGSLPKHGSAAAWGLLFSYGFWRYATTVEIYIPAAAPALAAFVCACAAARKDPVTGLFAMATLLSIAALLLHLVTAPVTLAAIPALYLCQKQWRRALLHGAMVGVGVAAVYGLVSRMAGTVVYVDETIQRATPMSWKASLLAIAAAGHTIISGNFLFAWPSATLSSLSAGHMLHEEWFMGAHAPVISRWLTPWTASFAMGLMLWCLIKGVQNALRLWHTRALLNNASVAAAGVWLAGQVALALYFEASNPEMWILALPPLWWLVGHAFGHSANGPTPEGSDSSTRRAPLWAAVTALLIHNAVGGMALVWSADGDYALSKTRLITDYARAGDWVLTADSHSTVTCLKYHTAAKVVDGRFVDVSQWKEMLEQEPPRRVWILREFFDPPPAIQHRPRRFEAQREALAERLRARAEPVGPADRAMIYRWTPPEPPPPGDQLR